MQSILQRRMRSLWRYATRMLFRPPWAKSCELAGHRSSVDHAIRAATYLVKEELTFSAGDWFTTFRSNKDLRCRRLKDHLPRHFGGVVYVSRTLYPSLSPLPSLTTRSFDAAEHPDGIENSIVLINNNDLTDPVEGRAYVDVFLRSPTSVFVGWDFDNHHWIGRSAELAAWTDVYVPAHAANLFLLSRFNTSVTKPVACGVMQWTREFLTAQQSTILHTMRSEYPLGQHVEYADFQRRNQIVKALSRYYPHVRLTTQLYQSQSPLSRLAQWSGHACHWIVPVLGDCPIRLFDALATGGIPIAPRSLIEVSEVREVAEHIVFYDEIDIDYPHEVVFEANRRFRARGVAGILERHRTAVARHHVDARIQQILGGVAAGYLMQADGQTIRRSPPVVRV